VTKKLLPYVVLAVPFIVAIVLLRGLTLQFPSCSSPDEQNYHYPVIIQFALQFPHIDLSDYSSSTTPLFHLIMMGFGAFAGLTLYKLRLLNACISYAAIIVLFRFLFLRMRFSRRDALLFSLLFLLSPYFFGSAFVLLTDNLGLLFCFLSLGALAAFQESGKTRYFFYACALIMCATLTRQLYVWLALVAAVYVFQTKARISRKLLLCAALACVLAPLGFFIALWKGLVPPFVHAQYASVSLVNTRVLGFMAAVIGMYALFFNPELITGFSRARFKNLFLAIVCAAVLLAFFPLAPLIWENGFLWRLASFFPRFHGTSVLLWVLVPFGLYAVLYYARFYDTTRLPFFVLISFLAVMAGNSLVYQKHFDVIALFALILFARNTQKRSLFEYACLFFLLAGFVMYVFVRQNFAPAMM